MVGTRWSKEVVFYECEKCCNVGWISSIVDITEAKELCFVSISRSKVLRLLVVDLHGKCVVCSICQGQFVMD